MKRLRAWLILACTPALLGEVGCLPENFFTTLSGDLITATATQVLESIVAAVLTSAGLPA